MADQLPEGTWGFGDYGAYMELKRRKLDFQQMAGVAPLSNIFKGIVIWVNGRTDPTATELRDIICAHGGEYEYFFGKTRVTHMIASALPNNKIGAMTKNDKIVYPNWITESVAAGKLLPWHNYSVADRKLPNQSSLSFASVAKPRIECTALLPHSTVLTTAKRKLSDDCYDLDAEGEIAFNQVAYGVASSTTPSSATATHALPQAHQVLASPMTKTESNSKAIQAPAPSRIDNDRIFPVHHRVSSSTRPANPLSINMCQTAVNPSEPNLPVTLVPPAQTACRSAASAIPAAVSAPTLNDASSKPAPPKNNGPVSSNNDPEFVVRFFNSSRLHHLSTWGAEARNRVSTHNQTLTDPDHQARQLANDQTKKVIAHIDMDSFFVSVSLLSAPHLVNEPCAVGHSKNGGIESSCELASVNYPARQRGLKNGMFLAQARKLCPELNVLEYQYDKIEELSSQMYEILQKWSGGLIMAISCDEAMLDITQLVYFAQTTGQIRPFHVIGVDDPSPRSDELQSSTDAQSTPQVHRPMTHHDAVVAVVAAIRQDIFEATKCTVSAGVSNNMLLARMTTRMAKPNGQKYFDTDVEDAAAFLAAEPVKALPGVGWKLNRKFEELNIVTCADLAKRSMGELKTLLGPKTGKTLFNYCRGIDTRPLKTIQFRQSVSAEISWGVRFDSEVKVENFIRDLAKEVNKRCISANLAGKKATLKLKLRADAAPTPAKFLGHGKCTNSSKSTSLAEYTIDAELIANAVIPLYYQIGTQCTEVRGVGIQLTDVLPLDQLATAKPTIRSVDKFFRQESRTLAPLSDSHAAASPTMPRTGEPNTAKTNEFLVAPSEISYEFREAMGEEMFQQYCDEYERMETQAAHNRPPAPKQPPASRTSSVVRSLMATDVNTATTTTTTTTNNNNNNNNNNHTSTVNRTKRVQQSSSALMPVTIPSRSEIADETWDSMPLCIKNEFMAAWRDAALRDARGAADLDIGKAPSEPRDSSLKRTRSTRGRGRPPKALAGPVTLARKNSRASEVTLTQIGFVRDMIDHDSDSHLSDVIEDVDFGGEQLAVEEGEIEQFDSSPILLTDAILPDLWATLNHKALDSDVLELCAVWVGGGVCAAPEEQKLVAIVTYLEELIFKHNIEFPKKLVDYLHFWIGKLESDYQSEFAEDWRNAYAQITEHVQFFVESAFAGARLVLKQFE